MTDPISFKPSDRIKFHMVAFLPEEGHFFLPKLRQRTFVQTIITEKNGEAIEPTSLEIGFYNDELPSNIRLKVNDDRMFFDGLDIGKNLTAELKSGFPKRWLPENRGTWIEGASGAFFDLSTLKETDEAAPITHSQASVDFDEPLKPDNKGTGFSGLLRKFSKA